MTKFFIVSDSILQNAINKIKELRANGINPLVSISEKKEKRSDAQNRLMQRWFKDIHDQSKQGLKYEAGRCKFEYFLPLMATGKNEAARLNYDLIVYALETRGYPYVLDALANGWIKSTRTLTTKEFAEAMTAMQQGEYQYRLTDPQLVGLDGRF